MLEIINILYTWITKKTPKTPTKEIIKAKQIKEEFEEEYYATKDFR